jgi:soluble lytic murein transglycosylase-like protein
VREILVGDRQYRIVAVERDGEWIARAEQAETGERFGIECAGKTDTAAIERLVRWLTWQHEHASALEALQEAERAYHRTIAGSAFASPIEGPSAIELQKEAFKKVEAARERLDEIRARRDSHEADQD